MRKHEPTRRESHLSKLLADVTNGNRLPVALRETIAAPGTVAGNTWHATAAVKGITTNGTDLWLENNKQDKVFKYTDAVSRLSGSQNAASSFSLASGNTSPKDIVTNGVYLWVVNDSSTDKVFKYTVARALVGSWTIGSANSQPTGITIDPTNVSNIWIVDSGADKVFQYTAAASRTSGSQIADLSFALAVGNTNPQGIADPPAPAVSSAPTPAPEISPSNPDSPVFTANALQDGTASDGVAGQTRHTDEVAMPVRPSLYHNPPPTREIDQAIASFVGAEKRWRFARSRDLDLNTELLAGISPLD